MGKIIAVANQKGGVGKTTTSVNLAAALGRKKKKTLLIDTDPQGNATSGVGVNKREMQQSVYNMLIGNTRASQLVQKTKFDNLWVIPASMDLAGAEVELVELPDRINRLKKGIIGVKDQFDFIIIDCPPSLGLITLNALNAADSVLIPIQCEYYALEGLSQLMATVRTVKKKYNNALDVEGVLLTMFDGRLNLTTQVVEEVKKYFAGKVYKTVIPRNVRLSEAPSFGEPVLYYDKGSKGSKAYLDLTQEVIKNNKKK